MELIKIIFTTNEIYFILELIDKWNKIFVDKKKCDILFLRYKLLFNAEEDFGYYYYSKDEIELIETILHYHLYDNDTINDSIYLETKRLLESIRQSLNLMMEEMKWNLKSAIK